MSEMNFDPSGDPCENPLKHVSFGDGELVFDILQVGTEEQQKLYRDFARLEVENRAALNEFNPIGVVAEAEIGLKTLHSTAEEAEPESTAVLRTQMLRNIGLAFESMEPDAEHCLSQHIYRNNSVRQLRIVTREDGKRVPVYTELVPAGNGLRVKTVRLLSRRAANDMERSLEAAANEDMAYARVDRVCGKANRSAYEVRSILGKLDRDLAESSEELNRFRNGLIRTQLSKSRWAEMNHKDAVWAYATKFVELERRYKFQEGAIEELAQQEQDLRLVALGERMERRQLVARIGNVVVRALSVLGGLHSAEAIPDPHVSGAEFSPEVVAAADRISAELKAELRVARRRRQQPRL